MTHRGPFQPRTFCDSVQHPSSMATAVGAKAAVSSGWDVLEMLGVEVKKPEETALRERVQQKDRLSSQEK